MIRRRKPRAASSLASRLLLGATLAMILTLALVGTAVDSAYRGAALDAMAERLESTAFLVLATVDLDDQGRPYIAETLAESRLDQPGSGLHAGAITPHGSWESRSLLGVVEPPRARVIARGRELFRGPDTGGNWNVWALGLGWEMPDGEIVDLTIWAAEDPSRLESAISGFRADLWRWLSVAAAVLVLAQALVMLVVLRPLRRVAADVRRIETGERERMDDTYPRELQPLTANLNALLTTERANAEQYQRALGDLAHALKTPLAVIRARLAEHRDADSQAVIETVGDMQRLVRHELDRAARSGRRTMLAPLRVEPVLARVLDSMRKLYPQCGFSLDAPPDLTASIAERDLMELAGNLVDNAAKHGGRQVRVRARRGARGDRRHGLVLEVADDGPGIALESFERLLQRGLRGDERGEGQGFGLSIVEQIVASYGGTLELVPPKAGGTRIRITLPAR